MFVIVKAKLLGKKSGKLPEILENSGKTESAFFYRIFLYILKDENKIEIWTTSVKSASQNI